MAKKVSEVREFIRGAARRGDLVYVLSKNRAMAASDVAHTSVIGIQAGRWVQAADRMWDSTAIAAAKAPSDKVVFIGENGDAVAYAAGRAADERLSPDPVLIRNARGISGYVFACGMKRQVHKRIDEGRWTDVSAPFPGPAERVGFESIDGFTDRDVYAVGWSGEIWSYDGTAWTSRDSPTNVILSAVCCAGDGLVYAAGQQGVMVRGREDTWEVIPWEVDVTADLWDLCWFRERLYVATMTGLFTLAGNALIPVDFGGVPIATCYSLAAADGVLWSVGSNDIASFDGAAWRRFD